MSLGTRASLMVALALALVGCTEVVDGITEVPDGDAGQEDSPRDDADGQSDADAPELDVDEAPDADGTPDAEVSQDAEPAEDIAQDVGAEEVDEGPVGCPCFAGDGRYCQERAAALADEAGCELGVGAPGDLLRCQDGAWEVRRTCDSTCESGELGNTDECGLPWCDCFVRVAWCGASAARHALTLDPPCQIPLVPEHDQDVLACDGETWIVREVCEMGCFEAPTGTPDACLGTRTPQEPGWDACPSRGRIAYGVHPEASDRLRCAGVTAGMITQTIGSAPASAGYHAADGQADGQPYTAAIDLSTRGMSEAQIRALLGRLVANGFAAWYRKPGSDGWPSNQSPHIHAVFAGVRMKSQLRGQVRDFLVGRNGLSSHTIYRFWSPPADSLEIVRLLFTRNYTP